MRTHTYRRLSLSVALGAVLGALVIHAPQARADAQSYLIDVTGWGFTHTDGAAGLLRVGYGICQMLSTPGVDGDDAARAIYISTGWDVDRTDAANIVMSSVENLCPEYDRRARDVV